MQREARLDEVLGPVVDVRQREPMHRVAPHVAVRSRQDRAGQEPGEHDVTRRVLADGTCPVRVERVEPRQPDDLDALRGRHLAVGLQRALALVLHEDAAPVERRALLAVDASPLGRVRGALEALLVECDERHVELLKCAPELDLGPVPTVRREDEPHVAVRVEVTPHVGEQRSVAQHRSVVAGSGDAVGQVPRVGRQVRTRDRLERLTGDQQHARDIESLGKHPRVIGELRSGQDGDARKWPPRAATVQASGTGPDVEAVTQEESSGPSRVCAARSTRESPPRHAAHHMANGEEALHGGRSKSLGPAAHSRLLDARSLRSLVRSRPRAASHRDTLGEP